MTLSQALNPSEPLFYLLNNKTPLTILSNLNFFSFSLYSPIILISFSGLIKSCNYFLCIYYYFKTLPHRSSTGSIYPVVSLAHTRCNNICLTNELISLAKHMESLWGVLWSVCMYEKSKLLHSLSHYYNLYLPFSICFY